MSEGEEAMEIGCAQFEDILQDLDRPGTEGSALRESALAHAESCDRCARLMTRAESLGFYLREVAVQDAGAQAPPRIERALLLEFKRRKAERARPIYRKLAALATAAAVLAALGIALFRGRLNPHPAPSREIAGRSSPIASGAGNTEREPESQTAMNQADSSEYATAFVPLPYADDPATLNGGVVVRVLLSRTALVSLGLPVADVSAGERIPADIVLSEDGAPQAIRLVSQANLDQ